MSNFRVVLLFASGSSPVVSREYDFSRFEDSIRFITQCDLTSWTHLVLNCFGSSFCLYRPVPYDKVLYGGGLSCLDRDVLDAIVSRAAEFACRDFPLFDSDSFDYSYLESVFSSYGWRLIDEVR